MKSIGHNVDRYDPTDYVARSTWDFDPSLNTPRRFLSERTRHAIAAAAFVVALAAAVVPPLLG